MTAQELGVIRSVLTSSKVIDASASDGDVSAAHAAALSGPNATEYKATLAAQGVQVGASWLTIIGLVGGAIAVYFIWQHYQEDKLVDAHDYPEPRDTRMHLRGVRSALGTLAPRKRVAGCGSKRMGRLGAAEKYEFEPETRLEGYRRRAPARRK
jgi:hypothetical protein